MKKLLSLLIISLLFTSCSDDEGNCCTNIDLGISIKYLNNSGENLFDKADGYNLSDITIYHNINGEWEEYYEGNLDYPKGITTVDREDGTYLLLFPSTTYVANTYSETKIEFSDTDFDIIKTEIEKTSNSEIVTKVWYNDIMKWESFETERMFEIVK